jgi:hypothetical protein
MSSGEEKLNYPGVLVGRDAQEFAVRLDDALVGAVVRCGLSRNHRLRGAREYVGHAGE